ncbi:tyrosine-type recombinase/integrase, partial [Bacillus wiedmannii]|uniref:tyrosine-type recombinase/integrase n=1 Tax=Bacillus wiedmannii TaxID=1890302 RepID=UPI000C03480B
MDKTPHLIDVQPIRSKEQIKDMKWSLKRHCSKRDYILFLIGINTGLRISDLLQIETQTILKLKRKKRKEFKIKEGKTKKERMINLTSIFDKVTPLIALGCFLYSLE